MEIRPFSDDGIEVIAKGNIDAFFADVASGQAERDLAAFQKQTREAEAFAPALRSFEALLELRDTPSGRSRPAPRLRSEDHSENNWRPGMPPETGLEKSDSILEKAGSSRRKEALREWFQSRLACGESATDLIRHAERHSPETARLLRELATE